MRALTLTQPWAGLVASGIKLIENRPRSIIKRADFGSQFAIHASREIDESVYGRIEEIAPDLKAELADISESLWYPLTRVTGAVIGVVTVVRSVTMPEAETGAIPDDDQRRWFFGPIGYVLRDVRALATPVPCRGYRGFWHMTPKDDRERGEVSAVERAVLEQLS